MTTEMILELLINISDLVIDSMRAIGENSTANATEIECDAAVERLQDTADEVQKRLQSDGL